MKRLLLLFVFHLVFLHFVGKSSCSKQSAFISELAASKFSACTIFFVSENYSKDIVTDLTVCQITSSLGPALIPFRTATIPSTANYSEKVFYHQNSPNCMLIVTILKTLNEGFLTQVEKRFSPLHIPTMRKDKDYWIFLLPSTNLDAMLLSDSLPARIKFKIGIGLEPDGNLLLKTVCFFCGLNGSPSFVDLDGDNKLTHSPSDFPFNDLFPDYVKNLNGKLLTITTPLVRPLLDFYPNIPVNNAKRGVWKPLLDEYLVSKLNLTYRFVLSIGKDGGPGGGTGLELPNGTWIGTVGDVLSGRADLGIITAHTLQRMKLISYTHSYFYMSYLHFVTTTGQQIYSPKALVWPFHSLLWLCILLCTLLAFVIFKLLSIITKALGLDSGSFTKRGVVSKQDWGIKHQIFFVTTSFLDQDCVLPTANPLRCFVALWLFFALIVTTIYRAKLVLSLAFPLTEAIPETFDQLAFSKFRVGFLKHGDAAYNVLKNSKDSVYKTLFNKMDVITGAGLDCYQNVLSLPNYACIAYETASHLVTSKNFTDADSRKFIMSSDITFTVYLGMVFKSGSIFTDTFNRRLAWTVPLHLPEIWKQQDLHETVRVPKRQWWIETNQTDKLVRVSDAKDVDLTLKHISGAFYGLILLLLISSVAYVFELILRKFQRDRLWRRQSFLGTHNNRDLGFESTWIN